MQTVLLINLILVLLGILEQVASKLSGNPEMWEIVKKFLGLILAFRDWFTQQKQKEVDKIKAEEVKQHEEVKVEYENAKKRLEDAGYTGDAFESELSELRKQQGS